ncbi:hypothetical protein [Paenibacillus piri]|uniref:Uncharacterized protein n=1 Tax=Paenibacillus piri TaxID=2547395 RepID=A0A4R5KIZ6_9BACL|nr:hypothetical protein [Paenibacillus piri]TDF95463.1 hypothetical protein E1757_20355 [Paenibacillus piri]
MDEMENFMTGRNTFAMFVAPKISEYRYRSRCDNAAAKKIIEAHGRVTSHPIRKVVGSNPTFTAGWSSSVVEHSSAPFQINSFLDEL